MSHVSSHSFDCIEQRAAEWLVKVEKSAAPEAGRALAAWLAENPRHRAAFLRLSTAWRRAEALKRLHGPEQAEDPDLLSPERPPTREPIAEPSDLEISSPPLRATPFHLGEHLLVVCWLKSRSAVFAAVIASAIGGFNVAAMLIDQAFGPSYSKSFGVNIVFELIVLGVGACIGAATACLAVSPGKKAKQ